MLNRKVIALSGYKQSGKDTTAEYLVREYGFRQLSFAAKLKDMVANTYGVPREDLDSPTRKEMPLENLPAIPTDPFTLTIHDLLRSELASGFWTPRALCILEGSTKRSVNSNFWVKSTIEEVVNNPDTNYVISDMRYRSEADILKLFVPNIQLVRIDRYDSINTTDPSERDLDEYKFDSTISNRTTKEDLYVQINHILYRGII